MINRKSTKTPVTTVAVRMTTEEREYIKTQFALVDLKLSSGIREAALDMARMIERGEVTVSINESVFVREVSDGK